MKDQINAIQQAVDFFEGHLREEITVADAAAAANYSLFTFIRVFNRIVYHTPYDYLIRRRLSEAARELVESDKKIIDIAVDYCFHSSEVFSRAFKRMFDQQPSEYRSARSIDPRVFLASRTLHHLEHFCQRGVCSPTRVEREQVTLVGLMIRIHHEPEDVAGLWFTLKQELASRSLWVEEPHDYYGVRIYPTHGNHRDSFYMAGIVARSCSDIPATLVSLQIPAGTFACFHHRGRRDSLPLIRDYIYQTWLPASKVQVTRPIEVEHYRNELPARVSEWDIYLLIS